MTFRLAETDKNRELRVLIDDLEISDKDFGAANALVIGNTNLIIYDINHVIIEQLVI